MRRANMIVYLFAASLILSTCLADLFLSANVSFLRETPSEFLSFAIDTSLFRNMDTLPILDEKFIKLARHLNPAYVRYGGTSADCLFFNESLNTSGKANFKNVTDNSNFSITEEHFLSLYEFSKRSNSKMIFDLNSLIRNPDGSWDDSNAKKIIRFAKKNKMVLDWQLGNEPPNFSLIFNKTVEPKQLAKDHKRLRSLLDSSGYEDSLLIGPQVNAVGGPSHRGELYAKKFLQNSGDSINYVTWHQYYFSGKNAKLEQFIDVSTFNYLQSLIASMQLYVIASKNNIPMWISETSVAYDEGAKGISDRFVAGFLWLDKLGYSAKTGIEIVIRQSFYGQSYGLIASDLTPNPDWWISVIYKKFVSNRVLDLSTPDNFGKLRFYAHCTPRDNSEIPAITIFGVNIEEKPANISIQGIPVFSENEIFVYVLTSESLQSRSIQMNGEVLELMSNGDLPAFKPVIQEIGDIVTLPAYSMVFIIVRGANVPEC